MYNNESIIKIVGHFVAECNLNSDQIIICKDAAMVMHGFVDECERIDLSVTPNITPLHLHGQWLEIVADKFLARHQYNAFVTIGKDRLFTKENTATIFGYNVQSVSKLYRYYTTVANCPPVNDNLLDMEIVVRKKANINAVKMLEALGQKRTPPIGVVISTLQDYLSLLEQIIGSNTVERITHRSGDHYLEHYRVTGEVFISIRGIRVLTFNTMTGLLTNMLETKQLTEVNKWLLEIIADNQAN